MENEIIVFDMLQKILKEISSAYDLSQDINLFNENCEILKSHDASKIVFQLQKNISKYGEAIRALSLFTHVTTVHYDEIPLYVAYSSLNYINQNIPMYVAYAELKDKALEKFQRMIFENSIR